MWREMNHADAAEHAVYRVKYDAPAPGDAPFLGVKGVPGSDNSHFKFPEGVACDKDGRIYVADSGNNRVQVFDADGKFVKTLPVVEPYAVAVHSKTGAIYVVSLRIQAWTVDSHQIQIAGGYFFAGAVDLRIGLPDKSNVQLRRNGTKMRHGLANGSRWVRGYR